jgi:hypothetical protein
MMTQRAMYNRVKEIMVNVDVEDKTEILEAIEKRIEALNRKSSSKADAPSKRQIENEAIKANILTVLATIEKGTIAEITKAYNATYGTEYTSQKISSLVTQLKGEKITRTVEKKVAYFELA